MTHYDDLLQEGHKLIAEQHADILTDLQRQGEIIERQAETIRQQQEEIELWTKRTNVLWHKSLERGDRIEELEAENAGLKKAVDSLHKSVAHREAHNIYLTEQHAQAIREKDERIAELEEALGRSIKDAWVMLDRLDGEGLGIKRLKQSVMEVMEVYDPYEGGAG